MNYLIYSKASLLFLIICISNALFAQPPFTGTWTGAVNTDFSNSANWNPMGFPNHFDYVIIPSGVPQPIVSNTMEARGILVESGATLTIQNGGNLGLEKSTFLPSPVLNALAGVGLVNHGTVVNYGKLEIDDVAGTGIVNWTGSVFNNFGGNVEIKANENGLFQNGTFLNNNSGSIEINAPTGSGILSYSSFTNESGTISFYNIGGVAILGRMTNKSAGTILIGQLAGSSTIGGIVASVNGLFLNDGGIIKIDRTTGLAINANHFGWWNNNTPVFENKNGGKIIIGPNSTSAIAIRCYSFGIKNTGCNSVIDIQSNGIIQTLNWGGWGTPATFINEGIIFENSNQTSNITENNGVVINSNGGTFNITNGNPVINRSGQFGYQNVWLGCSNINWNDPGNWSQGSVPTASEAAFIVDTNNDPAILSGTNAVCNGVFINTGASLVIQNTASLTDGAAIQSIRGLQNHGTVTNNGTISLSNSISSGLTVGSNCFFYNDGGTIYVDDSGDHGIANAGTFENKNNGKIYIGTITGGIFFDAISTESTFKNLSGGLIEIDGYRLDGFRHHNTVSGTVLNEAKIVIHEGDFNFSQAIYNQKLFTNGSCGEIHLFDNISQSHSGILDNRGFIYFHTEQVTSNIGTATNNGVINYVEKNDIPGLVNNDIIVGKAVGVCVVSNALDIGGANSFTASSNWYMDPNLMTLAGTYDQANNEFTPTNPSLSNATTRVYMSISENGTACSKIVSIELTFQTINFQTWYKDVDGDQFSDGNSLTSCSRPPNYFLAHELIQTSGDCDDNDINKFPGQIWYKDVDGDDFSDGTSQVSCNRPANYYLSSELIATSGDCNDNNASIHPNATEVCDGIDNNCNSQTDEGVQIPYYRDFDMDGFGDPNFTNYACSAPAGFVADNTDCNDSDGNEYPGQVWYKDADGDDFSDGTSTVSCTRPANYFVASELIATSGDCNDNNANIHPNATEVCDGVDNNCNFQTDEGVLNVYYRDFDMDGFGDPNVIIFACSAPPLHVNNNTDCDDNDGNEYPGQVWYKDADGDDFSDGTSTVSCTRPANYFVASELTATSGDCNDNNSSIHPNATEVCDGIDNNCNTQTDEGVKNTYYLDNDSDGFGDPSISIEACSAPPNYVADNTDCNDADGNEYPGQVWYKDLDGDDFSDGTSQTSCARPADHFTAAELTATSGDCNDNNASIHPNAVEICDDIDNDCDGLIDTADPNYVDSQEPNAVCQNHTVELDVNGMASISETDIDNGSSDNCGIQTLELDKTDFTCNDLGNNTVTLTVTDFADNEKTCTATVEVEDKEKPNFNGSCASYPTPFTTDVGACFSSINFTLPNPSDNCAIAELKAKILDSNGNTFQNWTTNPDGQYPPDNYQIKWRAKDASGNKKVCTKSFTVLDDEDPNAQCVASHTIQLTNGTGSITTADIDAGSTDNCNFNLSLSRTNFDCDDRGSTTVTMTATDDAGNTHQCTSDIIVDGTTLTIEDLSQSEGTGSGYTFFFFKVERGAGGCTMQVDYATSDGTATLADNDYVNQSGTHYWTSNGSNVRYSIVRGVKDAKYESDEHFWVDLSNASAGVTITKSQGKADLLNDDATPLYVFPNQGIDNPDYIQHQVQENKVALYPNPVRDEFQLIVPHIWLEQGVIEVGLYDQLGKQISIFQLSDSQSVVEASTLPAGMYKLSFTTKTGFVQTERFVKVD